MKFLIIGLGTFGTNLAIQLTRDGHEVIALDLSEDRVAAVKNEISFAAVLDCTSRVAIEKSIPYRDMDACIVAIGENFEASLTAAAILQELGVKRLICRVINPVHGRLLSLLKPDELVVPERMAAQWMSYRLGTKGVLNSYSVGRQHDIAEIEVPERYVGKALKDCDLRSSWELNLVTIKQPRAGARGGAEASHRESEPFARDFGMLATGESDLERFNVLGVPKPDYVFSSGDVLVVFGVHKKIRSFIDRNC